jgi:Thymidylate synthase
MKTAESNDFEHIVRAVTFALAAAPVVYVGEWQAQISKEDPKSRTVEVEDFSFEYQPPWGRSISDAIKPNLPWAEEHFQERISGIAYNPPPSHVRWPFAQKGNEDHTDGEKFSHTYPERFWPNNTGKTQLGGIRYPWGDLGDLVELLTKRPGTRQAYLPVWFPEDLSAANEFDVRVPCSLGYHFLVRNGKLKCVYYIRSCDFYRHFRDDVYLAVRLQQWVAQRIGASPGKLVMHISSLHIFEAEQERVKGEAQAYMANVRW